MVLLPPQAGAVPLPPAPQDPPVLADVVHAKYYERDIEVAFCKFYLSIQL